VLWGIKWEIERMAVKNFRFPILSVQFVDERRFIEFWSSRYPATYEHAYQANIGKLLTERRLLHLFEWKNGGRIANHKLASIRRNYIDKRPVPPRRNDKESLLRFIHQPGGTIWRIFWLHCYSPATYPIFDQHVYRAMRKLTSGSRGELPVSNSGKATTYVTEYLPFHASFTWPNKKEVDEALWSYGKYLKGDNAI
jgi:hypothetical protein